jgi:hypothetical protein
MIDFIEILENPPRLRQASYCEITVRRQSEPEELHFLHQNILTSEIIDYR